MADSIDPNSHQKPLLVINRIPFFKFLFHHRLTPTFTILDPITAVGTDSSAAHTFLRYNAAAARAVLCIGPSPLRKDTLDCLPSLECVVASSAGYDHIDLSECRRRGISVANVGDAFSDDVADCAVGLLIDVLRKVSAAHRFVRAGSWLEQGVFPLGSRLGGKRVGIVGLGSIGSRVVKRLIPLGCSIAYTSRQKKPSVSFPYYANVYDLALDCDILILCCSLTNQTRHLINEYVLNALGKEGVVINIGRGDLINEKELVQFLVEGKIGGAGLDVFQNEPNVPKELFGLDNVVLSPHQAVLTPDSFKAAEDISIANLEAFVSNKPLVSPIRWD
ncbi:glyoxylate/hydroxypyruvate reductase HPR3-like [Chenopodium quinoa]|uniref:glyoxylate/hydroxypyruvate reductase HPR3-like n=1 Tax=Chenopodium quinoa TaxID=63459 RepID=UPI000B779D6F|nr:glyoxylate/hydroxypyruvate reductase HPR3-like [Chenopodium quinoa]